MFKTDELLSNGEDKDKTCTTLKKNASAFKLIEDCISRLNNSKPEFSQNGTKIVIKIENQSPRTDHLNEPKIVDQFVKNNNCDVQQTCLDDAFKSCIFDIDSDSSSVNDDIFNKQVELNEDSLTSKLNSNIDNHKRKNSLLNEDDNSSSCDTTCDHLYSNKTKKIRTTEDNAISKQSSKSSQEITVDIPKILEPYKNTLEIFLQKHICLILPTIDKCIECRFYQMKHHFTSDYDYDNIICRFYAFRQLKFTESGTLVVAGYPDPYNNIISTADLGLWLPSPNLSVPNKINTEASIKILEDTGGQFCRFVEDEKEALKLNCIIQPENRNVVWKKCVNGVRELCDVCKTSIFNHHWSCGKCGFVVCVDCFRNKLEGNNKFKKISSIRCSKKIWLLCSDQVEHRVDQLSITQILAGDSLYHVSKLMHEICILHNIPLDCKCIQNLRTPSSISIDIESIINISLKNKFESYCSNDDDDDDIAHSRLSCSISKKYSEYYKRSNKPRRTKPEDQHKSSTYSRRTGSMNYRKIQYLRRKKMSPKLSLSHKNTVGSYMWLCEGHLLFLLDPEDYCNYKIFQVCKILNFYLSIVVNYCFLVKKNVTNAFIKYEFKRFWQDIEFSERYSKILKNNR